MKRTRTIACLLALAMLLCPCAAAHAAQPEDRQTVSVEGVVTPAAIRVTVPTQLTFAIDGGEFTSVPAEIQNNSLAPCEIRLVGIRAKGGTQARVVREDAHTGEEWDNLSTRETERQIALGLAGKDGTLWAGAEGGAGAAKESIRLDSAGSASVAIRSRHGNAWSRGGVLQYDMQLKITMKQ